jgi:hypothetical protein
MNRWQHFYDLAAAQLAVTYAQTRNFDVAEKVAAAKRMAADARAFADAFKQVEEAAFDPEATEEQATERLRRQLGLPPSLVPVTSSLHGPKLAGVIPVDEPLGEASRTATLIAGDD